MINSVVLVGRITKDPEVMTTNSGIKYVRFTLACNRRYKNQNGERQADFINCVAWRNQAEFIGNYVKKGNLMSVEGNIQTGSYTNKEGVKVYTTDIVVEDQEFAESKNASGASAGGEFMSSTPKSESTVSDGFMNIPDGIDEELPFN